MAKKPRSQRRRKGKGDDAAGGEDNNNNNAMDTLSESHTVADFDSVTTFESDVLLFDGKSVSWCFSDTYYSCLEVNSSTTYRNYRRSLS